MIKKLLLLYLFAALSISLTGEVRALTQQQVLPCQYQETVISENPVSILYDTAGVSYENPITLKDFKSGVSEEGTCICQTSFDVINLVGKEVKVKVNYQLNLSVNDKMNITDRTRTHILRGFAKRTNYDGGEICKGACQIIESSVLLEYLPTNETFGKWEKVNVSICEPCNSKPCLNDGGRCELASECGGKHCVQSLCSNNEFCYNNNCTCSESEVQCENQRCIKKQSVPNGLQPFCSWEECESRFQNSSTGYCEKSPDKLTEEQKLIKEQAIKKRNNQLKQFFVLFLFIAVIGFAFYYLHQKIEKDKLRLKKEVTEKEIEKINLQDAAIKRKESELRKLVSLEKQTVETKEQIERQTSAIKEARATIEKLIKENEERLKKATKDYKSPILGAGVREWRDPDQNYYPCFFNNGARSKTLIHRHQAEKHIFTKYHSFFTKYYPNRTFTKLDVHHIDHDITNYRVENLIILTRDEHDNIIHENIKIGDRESGIKELLRLQLKAPHIEELKPKEV